MRRVGAAGVRSGLQLLKFEPRPKAAAPAAISPQEEALHVATQLVKLFKVRRAAGVVIARLIDSMLAEPRRGGR